jgi:hypothetical protein
MMNGSSFMMVSAARASSSEEVEIDADGDIRDSRKHGYDDDEDDDYDDDDDEDDDEDDDDSPSQRRYYEFTDVDHFPYYPEEFEKGGLQNLCGNEGVDPRTCIRHGMFILSDFVVAGVNLAAYGMLHPKFQLYEDFNIGPMLKGKESWKELLKIRSQLQRPSLSWYVDKVARKRW